MCSSIEEKYLLSRNIQYNLVTVMKSKEQIITAAMLLLITYTLSLSGISQAFPEGQESKTISSSGTIQIQTTTGIGIYQDIYCSTPLTSVGWGTLQPGESSLGTDSGIT